MTDVKIDDGFVIWKIVLESEALAFRELHDNIFWANWLYPADDNCYWMVLK